MNSDLAQDSPATLVNGSIDLACAGWGLSVTAIASFGFFAAEYR